MLIGFLTTLLVLDGLFLALFIVIQKGKGSMGLGALGGGAQTLFGGSGGQDLFQKITWVLGAIFMLGSLGLSILKTQGTPVGSYMPSAPIQRKATPQQNIPESQSVPQSAPVAPVAPTVPTTPAQ